MSTDDTENDHDYAVHRHGHGRDEIESLHTRRVLRLMRNATGEWSANPEQSTSRRTPNTDHNYVFQSRSMSINGSGGTVEDDQDIFDEESTEGGEDVLNSGSTTTTYETDTRSEDSISTVRSNSSVQTYYSDQSNSTDRTNLSEQTTDSLTSASEQLEREPTIASTEVVEPNSNLSDVIGNLNRDINEEVNSLESSSPPKKRKRLLEINVTPKVNPRTEANFSDEDDGLTCPICLDNWEMTGEHRLASLKCGHLFGDSCIRRWLQESSRQSGQKVCPQCKTKALPRDIRYLYAKRLRVIDRSEEHRMREQLNEAQSKAQGLSLELATLKMSYTQVTQKLKALESDNNTLNILLRSGGSLHHKSMQQKSSLLYKLFMDRNIEISKEPGCRVLTYAEQQTSLIVSQKSNQNLFPGYGLRFVDTTSFKPTNFLHTSTKLVRDISLSDDHQLLAAASMEPKVKLFDLRTLAVSGIFQPTEKPIWSCSVGRRDSVHFMYLGSQHGSIYVYDTRFSSTFVNEHHAESDLSPVVQVSSVPACQLFPLGGFLVCKLTSVWFYEHSGAATHPTRLSIEGRFISMDFDSANLKLLVQTRNCARYPRARYILGKLNKINELPIFEISVTFFASTNSPVMARSSQICVDSNTLVAAYIQDSKLLSLYDANREQCVQSLPAQDIIYDTCPVYIKDFTYLAALTETKCRLYKLNST